MAVLNIKDERAHRLARELADRTGENLTRAVVHAIEEKLERLTLANDRQSRLKVLMRIANEAAALPIMDDRTPEEIIGYDEDGLPS